MYKRMLIPLDGSPLAEKVIPYAKRIANMLNLELIFLYVYKHNESISKFVCKAYIERVAEMVNAGLSSKGEIIKGNPAKTITNYTNEHSIDLVLLATHGQSGFGRWTTGSTAHKVITLSKTPILLIRPNTSRNLMPDGWPKTILIPLDGSQLAESVIPSVEIFTDQMHKRIEVTLLKVCEPPDLLSDYPEAIMQLSWKEHVKRVTTVTQQACGLYLGQVQKRLEEKGMKIRSKVLFGDRDNVAPEIAGYISKNDCDLIAMSTHGHSGISEWPYGHVADRLVRTVSVPLLLVRPQ